MNNRANSIINIDLIKEEVVNILKLYNPVVHTNAEEGYGWLCDGGYSITVEKNKKVILWVDLTDEITLGLGGFHEHLNLDLEGYEEFVKDLNDIVKSKTCSVCVTCNGKWIGSSYVEATNLSKERLIEEVVGEIDENIKEYGCKLECSFLDLKKDVIYEIPPVISQ